MKNNIIIDAQTNYKNTRRTPQSNEVEFQREKIQAMKKISKSVFSDYILEYQEGFVEEMLTVKMAGFVYENMADERELVYCCPKPSFLDWLLRRKRKVVFNLKTKDLLIDPPKLENTARIYVVQEKIEI
jgi:hypothetical protein